MISYNRLLVHTAVVERYSGTVNAAGDVPYDDDSQWTAQSTIDCRRLTTRATNTGGQQVAEPDGRIRRWGYQVYAKPDSGVLFGDRLVNITTKETGDGGVGWGRAATVLDAGPLLVTAVTDVIERHLRVKVLEVERVT